LADYKVDIGQNDGDRKKRQNSLKGYALDLVSVNELYSRIPELQIVKSLPDTQRDVDAVDKRRKSSLIYAACEGHRDTAEMLLSAKAKVDIQDDNGNTALTIAACDGYKKIVEMLLNAKAKVDIEDSDGDTAVTVAQQRGHTQIVEILQRHIRDVTRSLSAKAI
jgi:ankyrin repeat protein